MSCTKPGNCEFASSLGLERPWILATLRQIGRARIYLCADGTT